MESRSQPGTDAGADAVADAVADAAPEISVLVPVLDEAESVAELVDRVRSTLQEVGRSFEIVFVDDGSQDGTVERVRAEREADPRVKLVRFRRNFGKAAAISAGIEHSRGELVFTMDGDLQDVPEEMPRFLEKLESEDLDLVSGWKRDRQDPISKRWPSKLFNRVTRLLAQVELHDFNCGFKLYRRDALDQVRVYGELHRYIPVLMHHRGFRVGEIPVQHHPRRFGESKYGLERFTRGFLDLLTVILLTRYATRPLHAFGGVGLILGAAGFGLLSYLSALKFAYGEALSNRPLLLLGILLMLVGLQSISTGLIGEMIARSDQRDQTQYVLADLDSASNRALASLDLEAPAREADIHELPVEQPSSDINPDIEKAANHT